MDTLDKKFINAVVRLQTAVVEFVQEVCPQGLDSGLQKQTVMAMLQQMLESDNGVPAFNTPIGQASVSNDNSDRVGSVVKDSGTGSEAAIVRSILKVRYSMTPVSDDNRYVFKRLSEEHEDKFFQIDIYNDNTTTFSLLQSCLANAEDRQTLKDNADRMLPRAVASFQGEISDVCTIVEKGIGHMEGRIMVIDSPVKIKFGL